MNELLFDARGALSAVDRWMIEMTHFDLAEEDLDRLLAKVLEFGPSQKEELHRKLVLNDCVSHVAHHLERSQRSWPGSDLLARVFTERRGFLKRKNGHRWEEARRLFEAFAEVGVEVLVLKGGHLAESQWQDPAYKKMNDVDILVRFEDVDAVLRVFERFRYLPLVLFEGFDPRKLNPEKTHHLPSFVSRDLECVIGTHWNLVSPRSEVRIDPDPLWNRSETFDFHGLKVRCLEPMDDLFHLAVHFSHYKTGLREFADVLNVCRQHPGRIDWDQLLERFRQCRAVSRAHDCLSLAESLRPLGAPQRFFLALEREADAFTRDEVQTRQDRLHLLFWSRSTYPAEVEKAYSRYAMESLAHRKALAFLRFLKCLGLPPREVLRKNNCLEGVRLRDLPGLYLNNLSRTSREAGKAFGLGFFFLVLLQGIFKILGAIPYYFLPRKKTALDQFLEGLDGDSKRLDELVDFLE